MNNDFDQLRTFADVQTMLGECTSHEALCALNDAVEARFAKDRRLLAMTDADWVAYTNLLAIKAAELEFAQMRP